MGSLVSLLQFIAGTAFALVAGSVFGIWRGYDPTTYAAATFLETHQGAVRGLNVLLPSLAFIAIGLTIVLAWLARDKGPAFWLYVAALLFMIGGGLITRVFNQPINALVMDWTPETLPATWTDLRAAWWNWHLVRTGVSVLGFALLFAAILIDRTSQLRG